jgi:hypothetical protein
MRIGTPWNTTSHESSGSSRADATGSCAGMSRSAFSHFRPSRCTRTSILIIRNSRQRVFSGLLRLHGMFSCNSRTAECSRCKRSSTAMQRRKLPTIVQRKRNADCVRDFTCLCFHATRAGLPLGRNEGNRGRGCPHTRAPTVAVSSWLQLVVLPQRTRARQVLPRPHQLRDLPHVP